MSRTFRRKGYEASVKNAKGSKIAGYYTEYDYTRYGPFIYREPTKLEYYKEYWLIHGESRTANSWSPDKWFRNNRMVQNRSINNQEMHKYLKCAEYEPMFETNPRSHKWDWD